MRLLIFLWLLSPLFGFAQNKQYPDSINKKRLLTVAATQVGTFAAGVSGLGLVWYKDHDRVPFHFYNDVEGYLQMDKAGHSYVSYWESRASYNALRWAGLDKTKALIFGGTAGFIFQTPIEVFDGLFEGWGFSWWDMAANGFGSALFITQEAIWDEQIVLMKFSYSPSIYPEYHYYLGETHFERFFLDYNAHTYWLSANLEKITGAAWMPPWLNIAFGYSANGMIFEYRNPEFYQGRPFPHLERYRQVLISLDVDFSRIETDKKWVRTILSAVNVLKVPFPALEWNRINGLSLRGIYF